LREAVVSTALGQAVVSTALGQAVVSTALRQAVVSTALGQAVVSTALGQAVVSTALGQAVVSTALGQAVVCAALRAAVGGAALGERFLSRACVVLGTALRETVGPRQGRIGSLGERLRAGGPVAGRASGDRAGSRRICVTGSWVSLRQFAAG
jgi:hypothetical protein